MTAAACALAAAGWIGSADGAGSPAGDDRPVLRVSARISPAGHLPYPGFALTLETALLQRFSAYLGHRLQITGHRTTRETLGELKSSAKLASLGTVPARDLRDGLLEGPGYLEIHPRVVYCAGKRRPTRLADLGPRPIQVGDGSWHADLARAAGMDAQLQAGRGTAQTLRALVQGCRGHALADQHELVLLGRSLPALRPVLGFGENAMLRWWFPDDEAGRSLRGQARRFFDSLSATGDLDRILADHLDHIHDFPPGSAVTFMERIRTRLPRYLPAFREAARRYGVDWRLLAAIAYQESHWDPQAVSPTGVRGLMMLTEDTAREMELEDRHHATGSLEAGTAYLLKVKAKIPKRIREPDRTWMALAAYNIGFGHLEDARILAQDAGADPDRWLDVRPFLFRLDDAGCERLKRGCARGGEGAVYVRRIRNYLETLVWLDVSGWLWEIPSLAGLRSLNEASHPPG